jgi:hypothetical protein
MPFSMVGKEVSWLYVAGYLVCRAARTFGQTESGSSCPNQLSRILLQNLIP